VLRPESIIALAAVPLFDGLTPEELDRVAQHVMEQEYGEGHEIVIQDHWAAAFYLILDGTATVLVDGEARRTLGAGDYFGELSVIDVQPRSATVVATSPLTALVITAMDFRPVLSENWTITETILVNLCSRIRELEHPARH
jgi:CRP-like cAMP-binding protein